MIETYIALGSNQDQPLQQVEKAIAAIQHLGTITAQSPWYQSAAIGPGRQEDYINGVICLNTSLSALELLDALQSIEKNQGRVRTIRWGARNLDLDILLYGGQVIHNQRLNIPHPRMFERNFVLYPLFDIAPSLIFPNQEKLHDLLKDFSQQGLEKLAKTR